jgi:hypothetical protein
MREKGGGRIREMKIRGEGRGRWDRRTMNMIPE